jgi:tetratricopeptide (TPR) repeat protein
MMRLWAHMLFLFCFLSIAAQQSNKDSLLKVISKKNQNCPEPCMADTNKVNALNNLVLILMYSEPEKNYTYAKEALELSEKLNWKKGIGDAYHSMGVYYYTLPDYQKAINYWLRALKIREEIGNKTLISNSIGNVGLIYHKLNNYPKAVEYITRALKTDEESGNIEGVSRHLCNLGIIYSEQKKYSESTDHYLKALELAEKSKNQINTCVILNNIGLNYSDAGEYAKALEYFAKALKQCETIDNKSAVAAAYGNMGIAFEQQGDYKKALAHYQKALLMNINMNRKNGIILQYSNIGSLYTTMGKFQEAEGYLLKSLQLADSIDSQDDKKIAQYNLSRLYDTIGLHKKALEYYKVFVKTRDQMYDEEREEKLMELQATYEFNKKTALLEAEQEKERAIAETERKKQQSILWIVAGGLLLMAFFTFNTYRKNKTITLQKNLVEKKNIIIEEKQREITESINYAQRIQQAILPPVKILNEVFKENFVLYKPKDIVAGDFYWIEKVNDTIYIAAADSTGHGVPGAMVSVVCSNALNRSIKEFKLTEPGKILDKARELVLETFEKSSDDVKDGMDISLLCYNSKTNTLLWSGANNPLWYVQNNEITEIKADKQPIGKTEYPKPFTTHQIEYKENTIFYLFTDGLADQFGGPKGKKFKYKQFLEMVAHHVQLPLIKQAHAIENTFNNWKGELEQVDDVCVIGIKL